MNGSKSTKKIEVVLCQFKLLAGDYESIRLFNDQFKKMNSIIISNKFLAVEEERLGFIFLDQITAILDQLKSKQKHT